MFELDADKMVWIVVLTQGMRVSIKSEFEVSFQQHSNFKIKNNNTFNFQLQ
jgi:hypothetical protein